MEKNFLFIALLIMLLPLLGSLLAGLVGKQLGRRATHFTTIILVGISFLLSIYLFTYIALLKHPPQEYTLYTWLSSGIFHFDIGLLIDPLSTVMALVVTFVSFMVHIYTIGYMEDDPGYQRFFSYVSLFTCAMFSAP